MQRSRRGTQGIAFIVFEWPNSKLVYPSVPGRRYWICDMMMIWCVNWPRYSWWCVLTICLDSKVHGSNMGPTWVLSAPCGPHVGPINLAVRVNILFYARLISMNNWIFLYWYLSTLTCSCAFVCWDLLIPNKRFNWIETIELSLSS